VVKPIERWEALDSKSFSKFFLLSGIDFSNNLWWVQFSENRGCLLVLWGKFLAVTAPGGVELDEEVIVFGNSFIKIVVGEDENSVIPDILGGNEAEEAKGAAGECL